MRADLLHVVGAFSNYNRYQVRARLLREWLPRVLDAGARVTIVQHTLGERDHELKQEEMPHATLVSLRGGPEHEVWLQHALYNAGIARLPEDWRYVCWQDTDVRHLKDSWVTDTLHMLQHYRVGQTWHDSMDLGPKGEIVPNDWGHMVDRSFSAAWKAGDISAASGKYDPPNYARSLLPLDRAADGRSHTGYSWAIRKDALRGIGRLLDWMILGSGDYHLAHGFAGTLPALADASELSGYSQGYVRRLREFARNCEQHIKQDIGCVDGTLVHSWHGSKRFRFYGTRDDVMRESKFDPDHDIAYDVNGMPVIVSDNRILRDGIRRYNARRSEDSIDV